MKFAAKIKDIGRTLEGNLTLTLESHKMDPAAAMELSQVDKLDVEIKKYREKRSLDANAYYWKLASELAEALHVSKPYIHNYLLREYGQKAFVDGQIVQVYIPDTDEAEEAVDEEQKYHLAPTDGFENGKDGTPCRVYHMLRGSHEYDTKEMSHLIDGLISECKENGIETLPPWEVERMMKTYAKKNEKRAH